MKFDAGDKGQGHIHKKIFVIEPREGEIELEVPVRRDHGISEVHFFQAKEGKVEPKVTDWDEAGFGFEDPGKKERIFPDPEDVASFMGPGQPPAGTVEGFKVLLEKVFESEHDFLHPEREEATTLFRFNNIVSQRVEQFRSEAKGLAEALFGKGDRTELDEAYRAINEKMMAFDRFWPNYDRLAEILKNAPPLETKVHHFKSSCGGTTTIERGRLNEMLTTLGPLDSGGVHSKSEFFDWRNDPLPDQLALGNGRRVPMGRGSGKFTITKVVQGGKEIDPDGLFRAAREGVVLSGGLEHHNPGLPSGADLVFQRALGERDSAIVPLRDAVIHANVRIMRFDEKSTYPRLLPEEEVILDFENPQKEQPILVDSFMVDPLMVDAAPRTMYEISIDTKKKEYVAQKVQLQSQAAEDGTVTWKNVKVGEEIREPFDPGQITARREVLEDADKFGVWNGRNGTLNYDRTWVFPGVPTVSEGGELGYSFGIAAGAGLWNRPFALEGLNSKHGIVGDVNTDGVDEYFTPRQPLCDPELFKALSDILHCGFADLPKKVRIQMPKSASDRELFKERLKALGVDVDPGGFVTQESVGGVKGGMEVLQAAAEDGGLTLESLEKLLEQRKPK